MFIDYVSVKQTHLKGHQPFEGEYKVTYSPDGKPLKLQMIPIVYSGTRSDSTTITIISDGHTVKAQRNIGLVDRFDNLFNYDLDETMLKLNQIIEFLDADLPPFTKGELYTQHNKETGQLEIKSTGARFLRLDLTNNFMLGTMQKCNQFYTQLSHHKINRQKLHLEDNTIYWGWKSTHKQLKAYIKSQDLKRLLRKKKTIELFYVENLIQYTEYYGVIRIELQLREYLAKNNLALWAECTHEKLTEVYNGELMKLPKSCEGVKVLELTQSVAQSFAGYMCGLNMKNELSNSTFYRHRQKLLEYGLDIQIPLEPNEAIDTKQFAITAELKELPIPPWYHLPKIVDTDNIIQLIKTGL